MDTTHNTTDGDAVSIDEALNRLGNKAPTQPTFMQAVNRGKIRKVTNKEESPDGKIRVLWTSVQAYIASGGFKLRVKSNSTTENKTETTTPATGEVVPASPTDRITTETGIPNPPPTESPLILPSTNSKNRNSAQIAAKPHHCKTPNRFDEKRKPAPQREHAMTKGQVKPAGDQKSKVRNSPPLRVIKNGLRHLDFEQTKSIRDWADNRLLTVLRPALPLASTNANNENPTPA